MSIVRSNPGWTIAELDQFYCRVLGGMPGRYEFHDYLPRLLILEESGAVRRGERRVCRVTQVESETWWENEK